MDSVGRLDILGFRCFTQSLQAHKIGNNHYHPRPPQITTALRFTASLNEPRIIKCPRKKNIGLYIGHLKEGTKRETGGASRSLNDSITIERQ
jgi:hypothetical protein